MVCKVKISVIERFSAKYKVDSWGCWIWQAGRTPDGYGGIQIGDRWTMAHRWAYEYWRGKIPEGLELDHLCRKRACVNPYHLEAVTHRVNMMRSVSLAVTNARLTHCKHGHAFEGHNLIRRRNGQRDCRACQYRQQRAYQERRKAAIQTT